MLNRRDFLTLAAAAASASLASACGALDEGPSTSGGPSGGGGGAPGTTAGGGGGSGGGGGATQKVRVGYLHTIAVDDKLFLGLNDGHWNKAGLEVEATKFDTGIAVSQALAGGSLDVAIMGGVTSNFPARGQGKIFMLNSLETDTAQLWAHPKSNIKSVADLKGKQIATTEGTTADIYLLRALTKAGLKRTDVKVVNSSMPNAVQAFVSGAVDAIALWVPFDLRVKAGVQGATMIDSAKNYPDAAVADGWIANNNWYKDNTETIKKIISGWLAINAAFRADPEGSLKKVHQKAYANDAKLEDLQHQIKFQTDYTNKEWLEHYRSGKVLQWVGDAEKAFVELGGLPKFVDPKEFFDTSLFISVAEKQG